MSRDSTSAFVVTCQLEATVHLPQFAISAPLVADGEQIAKAHLTPDYCFDPLQTYQRCLVHNNTCFALSCSPITHSHTGAVRSNPGYTRLPTRLATGCTASTAAGVINAEQTRALAAMVSRPRSEVEVQGWDLHSRPRTRTSEGRTSGIDFSWTLTAGGSAVEQRRRAHSCMREKM